MAITWITPSGTLGTFEERSSFNIPIQATATSGTVSYSLIAGKLPRGLRLENGSIKGTTVELKNTAQYKFVVRASTSSEKSDRTFNFIIEGPDAPRWITPEGFLPVGDNDAYFVLDDSYVDFQLEATDPDLIAGDELRFYIPNNGGELPPGLTLLPNGRIQGYTKSLPKLQFNQATGNYDTTIFDAAPFDLGPRSSVGFDTFTFDNDTFDYAEPAKLPKSISRFYSFVVTVTDGLSTQNRSFKIYVIDEEFLRADNAVIQVSSTVFRADNNNIRTPFWVTPTYLGKIRASNYATVFIDIYNPPTLNLTIGYFLENSNPDNTPSELPPGLRLDSLTGELVGKIPYQPKITKRYKFTIRAVSFGEKTRSTQFYTVGDWDPDTTYNLGDIVKYIDPLVYEDSAIREGIGEALYLCLESHKNRPPSDISFWNIGAVSTTRTFTVDIIGDVESGISWITDRNLGTIRPQQDSMISVKATSSAYGGTVTYTLTSGSLPPGLELLSNGNIIGKVNKIGNQQRSGITRFYDSDPSSAAYNIVFDNGITTFNKTFTFTVTAKDALNFSSRDKVFTITVKDDDIRLYSNIYARAFQTREKRDKWYDFITDSTIFDVNKLYRTGDPAFGVQTDLKILMYAGIESVSAEKFIQAMSRNHGRKKIRLGQLRKALGKNPETQEVEYEVVFVDVVDELEVDKTSISKIIELPDSTNSPVRVSQNNVTVDSGSQSNFVDWDYRVSDRDVQRVFPNSIKNMRSRLQTLGNTDRTFLPLWMRSIQTDEDKTVFVEPGYTKCLILCYTKPGEADKLISRIKLKTDYASRGIWLSSTTYQTGDSVEYKGFYYTAIQPNSNKIPGEGQAFWNLNFSFKLLNFEIDRYTIDFINGQDQERYLPFPNNDLITP